MVNMQFCPSIFNLEILSLDIFNYAVLVPLSSCYPIFNYDVDVVVKYVTLNTWNWHGYRVLIWCYMSAVHIWCLCGYINKL